MKQGVFFFLFFVVVGLCAATPTKVKRDVTDKTAAITSQNLNIEPDGNFQYDYQTSNGIAAQAQGSPKTLPGNPPEIAENIQGNFIWTSPEGKSVQVQYVADENGYRPKITLN